MKWLLKRRKRLDYIAEMEQDFEGLAKVTYRYVISEETAAEGSMALACGQDDALFEFKSGEYEMARKVREKMEEEGLQRGLRMR